jgi:hypothetical protein
MRPTDRLRRRAPIGGKPAGIHPAAGAVPFMIAAALTGAPLASAADAPATDNAPVPKAAAKPAVSATEAVSGALTTLLDQQKTLIDQQKMMIDLLNKKGMLSAKQASAMSANADKMAERAEASVAQVREAMQAAPAGPKLVPGAMNIPYVPEHVRNQIRDQVKQEVLAEAKSEGWAAPGMLPDWLERVKFEGDIRLRGESDLFKKGNSPDIFDFNSLLAAPFDVNQNNLTQPPPTLNTQTDRDRFRLRARLGLEAEVADGVSTEFRISTGTNTNPGSLNQTYGPDFNNETIVLDRANIRFQPVSWLTLTGGRIPNLFVSTTLLWAEDLNFDGFEARVDYPVRNDLNVVATLGALPLQFTDLNFFSNTAGAKYDNLNKWLYAGQIGANWQTRSDLTIRAAAAYYDFDNYSGKESSPCVPANTTALDCDTDLTRPGFTQNGNTFFALRNLSGLAANAAQPQLFGLASKFDVLDINAAVDWTIDGPLHLVLNGDYAINLGYNAKQISALPIQNNVITLNNKSQSLQSGNQAYLVQLSFGEPQVNEWLDWNIAVGYRYIEPDAVVAAFNDQDFHLGGTNAQGYTLIGKLGLAHDTWASIRWFGAREAMGQPYEVDVLQLDLNTRF